MRQCTYKRLLVVSMLILGACFILVGCSSDFSPYKHMREIAMHKSAENYESEKNFILSHTAPNLRDQVDAAMQGSIIDPKYSIDELNVWSETQGTKTTFLAEYKVTTSSKQEFRIAYFTYDKDMLIDYKYTNIRTDYFMG